MCYRPSPISFPRNSSWERDVQLPFLLKHPDSQSKNVGGNFWCLASGTRSSFNSPLVSILPGRGCLGLDNPTVSHPNGYGHRILRTLLKHLPTLCFKDRVENPYSGNHWLSYPSHMFSYPSGWVPFINFLNKAWLDFLGGCPRLPWLLQPIT